MIHAISLRLIFVLCLASLCLFPFALLLDPGDTAQTLGLSSSPLLLLESSPPSTSTSEDLAVAVSQRRRGVQNTHRCLSNSSVFRKSERKGDIGRRKGRKRGICFHCNVVKPWLVHQGFLAPVTEKTSNMYFTCFYLS